MGKKAKHIDDDDYVPPEDTDSDSEIEDDDDSVASSVSESECSSSSEDSLQVEADQDTDEKINWKEVTSKPKDCKFLEDIYGEEMKKEFSEQIVNVPDYINEKSKPIDFFQLFFTEEFLDMAVEQSNLFYKQEVEKIKQKQGKISSYSRVNRFGGLSKEKIKLYLGIVLWSGLITNKRMEDNWNKNDNLFLTNYSKYISYNKYLLIHRFFHLSDNSKADKTDPVYKVRPLIDLFNEKAVYYNIPGKYVCIDETMVKFKGRLFFRQFNPNKPNKYGIKLYLLCNSIGYCYNIITYTGKGTSSEANEGFLGVESLVINMMRPYFNAYRILYIDNFYNTIKLSRYFMEQKTGLIGTLKLNRARFANKLVLPKKAEQQIYIDPSKSIVLVVANDNKIFMMTTNVCFPIPMNVETRREGTKRKLNMIVDYNHRSKGVDLCNQKCSSYRYPHPSRKWWKPLTYHIIQMILQNTYIISQKYIKMSFKDYYKSVIGSLIGEEKNERMNSTFHGIDYIDSVKKSLHRKSCRLCPRKTMWICKKCLVPLCIPDCHNKYHEMLKKPKVVINK